MGALTPLKYTAVFASDVSTLPLWGILPLTSGEGPMEIPLIITASPGAIGPDAPLAALDTLITVAGGASVPNSPVDFAVAVRDAGREVESVLISAIPSVAEQQRPKPGDLNVVALGVLQRSQQRAGRWVERVDVAVAEIAHQQRPREFPERGRRDGDAPRRVQWSVRYKVLQQVPIGIEDADEPVAIAGDIVLLVGALLGVGDVDLSAEIPDVERPEARGNARVGKAPRNFSSGELAVEYVDGAGTDVGGIEQRAERAACPDCEALVDGAGRGIIGHDGRGCSCVPGGYRSVFSNEYERCRPAIGKHKRSS